jgi:DNA primase
VAPLKPKADWPEVKAFTKALADEMASDDPDRYVSTITKSKRHGKILVDYLRKPARRNRRRLLLDPGPPGCCGVGAAVMG